jgi:hypothetical protein
MHYYFSKGLYKNLRSDVFSEYVSLPARDDPDRLKFAAIFQQMSHQADYSPAPLQLSLRESRGIAAVMGMAICDALGASTEF